MRRFSVPVLAPFPLVDFVSFHAEPQRSQRIAEDKAIDSAVLPARLKKFSPAGTRDLRLPRFFYRGISASRTIIAKTRCSFVGVALVLLLGLFSVSGAQTRESLFPQIKGWKLSVEETVYTPNNLWDVIDGAADLFLEYNFVDLHIGRYLQSTDLEIKVELYKHGSSLDAFGMYSQERYPDYHFVSLGVQGYIEKGTLNFLNGKYYVKISTLQSGKSVQDALMMIGRKLEGHLTRDRSWPEVLRAFPSSGKLPNAEQYIAKNFLGYSFFNGVFVASYNGGSPFKAFVMRMGSPEQAKKSLEAYFSTIPKEGISERDGGQFRVRDPRNGPIELVLEKSVLYGLYGSDGEKKREAFLLEFGKNLSTLH